MSAPTLDRPADTGTPGVDAPAPEPVDIPDGEDTATPTLDALDAVPASTPPSPGSALAVRKPTMAEKVHYAEQLCRSNLLPGEYRNRPENLLFATEYANTLGLTTMAAIQGIHVIKGKPTASGALMTALARNAGHRVRLGYTKGDDGGWGFGWCEIVRKDDPDYTFRVEWYLDDAVRAELCTIVDGNPQSRSSKGEKQSWEKFPKAMLKWRAVTECVREACEEVLYGAHYSAEEMNVEMDEQGNAVVVDGSVVMTETQDIAAKLVGDPDPVNWAAEVASCAGDLHQLCGLWVRATTEVPRNRDLHDEISACVPWAQLTADRERRADRDGLLDLHARAKRMRPLDAALLESIAAAGTRVTEAQPADTDDQAAAGPVDHAPADDDGTAPVDVDVVDETRTDTPAPEKSARPKSMTAAEVAAAASQAVTDLVAMTSLKEISDYGADLHPAVRRRDVSGLLGDHADTLDLRREERLTVGELAAAVVDYVAHHGVSVDDLGQSDDRPRTIDGMTAQEAVTVAGRHDDQHFTDPDDQGRYR